jgi:hypothetical protein
MRGIRAGISIGIGLAENEYFTLLEAHRLHRYDAWRWDQTTDGLSLRNRLTYGLYKYFEYEHFDFLRI